MEIAHVVCTFPPYKGGMGNSAFNFVKTLSKLGLDAKVFTPDYGDGLNTLLEEKFNVERIKPLFKFGNAAFLPQLFCKLKNFKIIHLHYPFYGTAEVIMLRKLIFREKTKLIIHYHMEPTARGFKGLTFKLHRLLFDPILMRLADKITCASLDYIKNSSLKNYYLKNKSKFEEIYFGVDPGKFRFSNDDFRMADKKFKNILFVGGLDRAHYFKGVDVLLEAVSKLKVKGCKLIIVGDGDMRLNYEKKAKNLGIADRVEFVGSVEDDKLPSYYQDCDIFVLPSINKGEAFGMVLLEAMACGKPVIASNLPGVRSVFKEGEHGLLVKPGDVNDLSEKITKLLTDDKLRNEMGLRARKLTEEKYTWNKVGERLNKVYRQVKS